MGGGLNFGSVVVEPECTKGPVRVLLGPAGVVTQDCSEGGHRTRTNSGIRPGFAPDAEVVQGTAGTLTSQGALAVGAERINEWADGTRIGDGLTGPTSEAPTGEVHEAHAGVFTDLNSVRVPSEGCDKSLVRPRLHQLVPATFVARLDHEGGDGGSHGGAIAEVILDKTHKLRRSHILIGRGLKEA